MDFQFHYSNTTQANGHLSGRDPCLEFEDVDDQDQDAFYEELRLQVSLLIAAAADDFAETRQSDKLFGRFPAKLQPGCYFDWCEWDKRDADSVPTWLENLWRKGKGTGVFIPQTVKSTRCGHGRNRMSKGKKRVHKQVEL